MYSGNFKSMLEYIINTVSRNIKQIIFHFPSLPKIVEFLTNMILEYCALIYSIKWQWIEDFRHDTNIN